MIILITGTTSGIGKLLAEYYLNTNYNIVIGVNNKDSEFSNQNYINYIVDLTNYHDIHIFLQRLINNNKTPDIFYLNAGVNFRDYTNYLDIIIFKHVIDINLYGVLNFISAITYFKLINRKIISISSTSNIVPNPSNIGYYISKLSLKLIFNLIEVKDKNNTYKTIILGPVKTKIMRNYETPSGLKKILLEFLSINTNIAIKKILKFTYNDRKTLYYPFKSTFFYILVSFIIKLIPSLKKYL